MNIITSINNMNMTLKKIFLIFFLFSCLFYMDKILLGPYAPIRVLDTFDSELCRVKATQFLISKFGYFAWYPITCAGMPSYAYQFSPIYILCNLKLPMWVIYSGMVILLMALAGTGMTWLLSRFMSMSNFLAILGGFIYCLYTQSADRPLVCLVFNFAFPFFFMCFLEGRILWVIFLMLISYPALTIKVYLPLQLILIWVYGKDRMKLTLKTCFIWLGYLLIFAPVLYALYEYIPFSQRHIHPGFGWQKSIHRSFLFLTCSPYLVLFYLCLPLVFFSKKVLKAFLLIALIVIATALFELSIWNEFLFLGKIDLLHMYWALPFAFTIYTMAGIEKIWK